MSGRRAAAGAVVTLVLGASLNVGAWQGTPDPVRLLIAFLALVMLPGHGWLAALSTGPRGGRWLASGWALPLGVAWAAVLVWGCHLAGVPFTRLIGTGSVTGVLPWVAAWACAPRRTALPRPPEPGWHIAGPVITLAALMAAVHGARLGTPLTFHSDSPDHIGTIRRMLETGNAFPSDAFFVDAGAGGADPRKGLWHPVVAWICGASRVDPVSGWRWLSMWIAPLFVLNAAAMGALLRGPRTAAFAAWALLITYGGSLGSPYLREAVFATKLADQCALAAVTALLMDLSGPSARQRLTVIGLLLGAVLAHVFAVIHVGLVGGALALGLSLRDRGRGAELPRLIVTGLLALAVSAPYLAWRAHGAYAPGNIIHLEPQGLLLLGGGWLTVSPGVLWDWMGLAWIVFPASMFAQWRHAWRTPVLLLLATWVTVAMLLFFPPLFTLIQPRLGYLMLRFTWVLPFAAALAFALDTALTALMRGPGSRRVLPALSLAGLAVLLAAPISDAVAVMTDPSPWREAERGVSGPAWSEEMAWMDRHLPASTVVLSDPATSYLVPMMTRHHVATLVDQHSSPNDSLALDRILDARDALDPDGSWIRTREVIERWGATAIVLNGRFDRSPNLDYWSPDSAWFARARARFDAEPSAFPKLHEWPDVVVYNIDRTRLDSLPAAEPPRPGLRALVPGERVHAPRVGEGTDLVSFALSKHEVVPGATIWARLEWHARRPRPAGHYDLFVRFEREVPEEARVPWWFAKPMRKLVELVRGERYRFRVDHTPTDGAFGVDRWVPGAVVLDSLPIEVPADIAPGGWQVQARLRRQPHYPNYQLRDYFSDADYYSGVPVDSLIVLPAPGRGR